MLLGAPSPNVVNAASGNASRSEKSRSTPAGSAARSSSMVGISYSPSTRRVMKGARWKAEQETIGRERRMEEDNKDIAVLTSTA